MKKNIPYLLIIAASFLSIISFSQAGSLDPTFGKDGKTVTNLFETFSSSGVDGAAIQSDGKIVAVGPLPNGSGIYRYNQDGSVDNDFGDSGLVFIYSFNVNCLAIQQDGKIVVAGTTRTEEGRTTVRIARYNEDGSLDNSFNGESKLTPQVGDTFSANSITIQADGKIVITGDRRYGLFLAFYDFLVARYNVDGSPDNSFDGDGVVFTDFGSLLDHGKSVAIQADGKIVVAGSGSATPYSFTGPSAQRDFAMARYNTDGSLDSSFDDDGMLITDIGVLSSANSIAIQADGKIVLAGSGSDGFAIARYNTDGSLDNSFDNDGMLITNIGASSFAISIAIQTDGRIVVAGSSNNGIKSVFASIRFNTDGSLDNSFDGDGKLTTEADYSSTAHSVVIQTDGNIILAGESHDDVSKAITVIARYNTDGSLDNSFDGDGILTKSIDYSVEVANAVAVQTDGKIVVAGNSYRGETLNDFAIARYNTDGSLDNGFDGDGKLFTDIDSLDNIANAIAIQTDGKIVVAGSCRIESQMLIAIARYNPDGSLDNSFDGDGKLTTDFSLIPSYINQDQIIANSVTIQTDGKILVAGINNNQFAIARYNTDGSLDNSFGEHGKLIALFDNSATSNAAVLQADGKIIVVGGDRTFPLINDGFAVARYNADGSPDNSFDGDGKSITDIGSLNDIAYSVAVQTDGRIVVAGGSSNTTQGYFSMIRYNKDGSLDSSFDGDGKLTADVGFPSSAHSVAIQVDGKIVLTGYNMAGSKEKSVLIRYNTDGSLDQTFGNNGEVVSADLTGKPEYGKSMTIFGNRIYIAGYASTKTDKDFLLAAYLVQSTVEVNCPSDTTVQAEPGQCQAVVNDIDPLVTPASNNSIVNYTLSGATSINGTGSASGQSFNKGVTTVTYSIAGEPEKICSFTVSVRPGPEICNNGKDDDCDGRVDEDCHKLPKIYISNTAVREGNSGTRNAFFELILSKLSDKPITVEYHTADLTAKEPGDYIQKSGTVTFPPNSLFKKIEVEVIGDRQPEANEKFAIILSDAVNGKIRDGKATCKIFDDDPAPAINIHDAVAVENCQQALIRVTLSESSEQVVTVKYYTKDGSGKAPEDYTAINNGTLVFQPGEKTKNISIVIKEDALCEPMERFYVILKQAENATFNCKQAEIRILNSDHVNNVISKAAPAPKALTDIGRMIVSPNPANQVVNLRLLNTAISGKILLELMDQNGRIVKQWIKNYDSDGQAITLPVADIPSGIYVVVIKDGKGNRIEQQVVVGH